MQPASEQLPGASPSEMFPALTSEQQARVLAHGRLHEVVAGETVAPAM